MDEGPPKPKKELSDYEALRKIMQEELLFAYQKAFLGLQKIDPALAELHHAEFEEFLEVAQDIMAITPDELPSVPVMERVLPNNWWTRNLKKMLEKRQPSSLEDKKRMIERLRIEAEKRKKGTDIN